MKNIQGKTALITGSGSGIGQNMALHYAQEGMNIGVADINIQAAQETVAQITAAGGKAIALSMNVCVQNEVNQAVETLVETFGSLDVMVSNAGIQIIHPIEELPFSDWQKMLSIQLDGAFLCTQAALKYMYPQKSGCVIYMGSIHSHEASLFKAPYVTAKHGLLGLARVLAKEGAAHNVASYVICPGFVKTPLVEKQIPEQAKAKGISEEEVVKNIMLGDTFDGEFTRAEDISSLAVFLAKQSTLAMSGQSFLVTHGWGMK